MYTQYHVKDKILDPYFPKHKLGIEIDKYDHLDRNFEDEQRRQFMAVKLLELIQMLQILTFTD